MGWRSTGAAFRAGNYSGPLTSDEGGFASGFAKTFTAGISKASDIIAGEMQAERDQEREKDLIRLRETLAAQRAAATSSKSTEEETAKQLSEARAFAAANNVTLDEAFTILGANDWNSRLAGDALSKDRKSGNRVDTSTFQFNGTSTGDTSAVTPAPAATPAATPAVGTASLTDNLLETEETAGPVLSDTQPAPETVQVANRGDTMTDVPISLITSSEAGTTLTERADEAVAELAANPPPPGTEPVTYEDRVAAGETPVAAATVIGAGIIRVPEMFALPDLTTITTLEQALAIRDVLEARRGFLQGATDDFYRNYAPVLEQRINSLGEGGLPDLGQISQENRRDELVEYVNGGWQRFQGIVDEETLMAHVRRAEELEGSGVSMPTIPSGLEDLRSMNARVQAGEFGTPTYVPREWRETLNSRLAEAELYSRFGSRLTPDYILDDERTVRELTGLLESTEGSLPPDHPVVRDLKIALRLRDEMPDDTPIPESLREAEVALARAIAADADPDKIARLTVDRDAALAATRANNPAGFTEGEYQVLLKGGRAVRARLQQDGTFIVPGGQAIPQDQILRTLSSEQRGEAVAEITRFRDDRLIPTRGQRQALTTMLPVAIRVADRLERNDTLLTTFGTTIPELFSRVGAEVEAIVKLASRFGGDPNVPNSFVDPNLFRQGVMSSLDDMSSDAAQHAADVIFLAYQVALSQNDRVTDQDFRTALEQIAKGSIPETFIPNMLNRVDDQIRSHDAMVTAALSAPEIRLYNDEYGDFPGFSLEDELQPFSDFAVRAGFEAEIQRFNELDAKYRGGDVAVTGDPDESPTFTSGEYKLNQALADAIRRRNPTPDEIKDQLIIGGGFTEDQVRTFFPEIFEEPQ